MNQFGPGTYRDTSSLVPGDRQARRALGPFPSASNVEGVEDVMSGAAAAILNHCEVSAYKASRMVKARRKVHDS